MKKYLLIITLILAILIIPISVLASDITNARYFGIIQISNNSTATTNVVVTANISTANLINDNYLNASANNSVVRTSSGADVPFMPSVNATSYPWSIWVPSIGENSFQNDILYTANSTGGEIRYFPGSGGMTTADNASLELGDNFTLEQKGYIDTNAGSSKNLINKDEAFRTYVSGSGNITSRILRIADTFPTGDAGADWTDRAKAYDDNTATYSWDDIPAESWGEFIELTHASIECEAIKFYAAGESVNINQVDIDVYYEGDWHDVYEGAFTHDTWTTKGFSADKSVTSMRLKFYNAEVGSARMAYLKEARFLTDVAVTASGVSSGEHTIKVTDQNALSFDGVNDSVDIAAPSGMAFGTGDFTLITWIYLGDYTNAGADIVTYIIHAKSPENNSAWGLSFSTDDNPNPANRRTVSFLVRTAGGVAKEARSGILTKQTWYMIAGKREGGDSYISVDGAAWVAGATGADMNYSGPNPVKIGEDANANDLNFLGNISETRTYSRGLSDSETSDIYDDQAISTTGLAGLWPLDEGAGGVATDSSGEGNNGVINSATWGAYIMKMFIDDALSTVNNGGSVPDNANNWAFLQNDAMPYMESHQITISDVLQQSIAWEYDTTFTDLSGNSHDATPTFRTASSDPDVSAELISFQPVAEAQAPDFVLAEAPPFIDSDALTGNVSGTFTTTPGAGTFPLAGVITAVANATSTPAQLPLLIIAVFVILAASLTVSSLMRQHGSGSVLVKILVITAFMGIFIALGNFAIDFWMLVVFLIMGIALAFASKQLGWA